MQEFPAIITLLTLFLLLATGLGVAKARIKYQIKAPATTGNVDFERVFRVQMNTQESALTFLPALWLFSSYVSPLWAGILGLVWVLARVHYAIGYARANEKRAAGFILGLIALAVLAGGASLGVLMKIMASL